MKNEGIVIDTLFVGPTRPTMYLGVTWQAFIINVLVTMEVFVWTHNLLWLLMIVPLHSISYLICLKEPRAFELIMLWGPTKGFSYLGTHSYWNATTFSPLETRKSQSRKRIFFFRSSK